MKLDRDQCTIQPTRVYVNGQEIPSGWYCKQNSLRFSVAPEEGSVIKAVFDELGLEVTSDPAPGSFSCWVYNPDLPPRLRVNYDDLDERPR